MHTHTHTDTDTHTPTHTDLYRLAKADELCHGSACRPPTSFD